MLTRVALLATSLPKAPLLAALPKLVAPATAAVACGAVRLLSGKPGADDNSVVQNLSAMDVGQSLSLEARLDWLQSTFSAMEPDTDGRIAVDNLDKLPASLTSLVPDVRALFDRDGDGRINLRQFSYGITFLVQLASNKHHSRSYYDNLMFNLMDDDGNGVVDRDELLSWIKAADMLGLIRQSYRDSLGDNLSLEELTDAIFEEFASLRGRPDDINREEFAQLSFNILDYGPFELYTIRDAE